MNAKGDYSHLKDLRASVSINGAEDIIKKIDVTVLVDGPGELYPLLLAATEVDSSLSNFGMVSKFHHLQVLLQAADPENLSIPGFIHWQPKEDVFLDGPVLDPCRLCYIGSASTDSHL